MYNIWQFRPPAHVGRVAKFSFSKNHGDLKYEYFFENLQKSSIYTKEQIRIVLLFTAELTRIFLFFVQKLDGHSGHHSWAARMLRWRTAGSGRTGHPGATPSGDRTSPTAGRPRTACCWIWMRARRSADGGSMLPARGERGGTRDTSAPMSTVGHMR